MNKKWNDIIEGLVVKGTDNILVPSSREFDM